MAYTFCKGMNKEKMRSILAEHLVKFRALSYDDLAREIDRTDREHDCLAHFEGVAQDGTPYQIELNVFWDDQPKGNIRVAGDISLEPQKRLLGSVPVFQPNLNDGFIMAPDGSFIGQNANTG